jgi:hypothetical protein
LGKKTWNFWENYGYSKGKNRNFEKNYMNYKEENGNF